jgi:acyl carrier protein
MATDLQVKPKFAKLAAKNINLLNTREQRQIMDSEQILELVKEVLELDDITLETELDDDTWDSLAVVTYIALANDRYELVLSPEKVIAAETVKDLL